MEKENKTSRANDTRSKSERPKVWVPPSSLDAPPAPDGFRYRSLHEDRSEAVSNDLMKEQDSRMPINVERQSRVTFGGTKK
jgi:hypothetical protein